MIQLTWPNEDTDWSYMFEEVVECYRSILSALLRETSVDVLIVTRSKEETLKSVSDVIGESNRVSFVETEINDTWARDHSPLTIKVDEERRLLLDFQFNGWGLKFAADKDNKIGREVYSQSLSAMGYLYESHYDMVLEGGAVESDGNGTLMTSEHCMTSVNRNGFSREEVERRLMEYTGVKRVLWTEHGSLTGDDTDGHIDTLARFAPEDTIVYLTPPSDEADVDYEGLRLMEKELASFRTQEGKPYKLVGLPYPQVKYDCETGERLPATYANFLYVNDVILLPVYDVPQDLQAISLMVEAFPAKKVLPIDCSALIRQHGSLHCVTMQYVR